MNKFTTIIILLIALTSSTAISASPTTESSDYANDDYDDDDDDEESSDPPPPTGPPPERTHFTDCSAQLEKQNTILRAALTTIGEIALAENPEIGNAILTRLNKQLTEADKLLSKWETYKQEMPELNKEFEKEGIMAYGKLNWILSSRQILTRSQLAGLGLEAQVKIKKELEKAAESLAKLSNCFRERSFLCGGGPDPRATSDAINSKVKAGRRQGWQNKKDKQQAYA